MIGLLSKSDARYSRRTVITCVLLLMPFDFTKLSFSLKYLSLTNSAINRRSEWGQLITKNHLNV